MFLNYYLLLSQSTIETRRLNPSQHLFVQSQQWKQQNEWNLFKVNNRHQSDILDVVPVFLLQTLNIFHTFF